MTSHVSPDHSSGDYKIPKPSRLNLRETPAERTARLHRAAKKEFDLKEEAIRKANKGYSDFPTFSTSHTSTSTTFASSNLDLDDLDDWDDTMGRVGMEANLARPSASGLGGIRPDIRIPSRYQTSSTTTTTTTSASHSTTHTTRMHYTSSSSSSMTDAQIQQEMYREMADKRERDRRAAIEVEQRKRKRDEYEEAEAYYRAQKRQERERRKDKDRIQREWERRESPPFGARRGRRGSTPVYGSGQSVDDSDDDFEILGEDRGGGSIGGKSKGKAKAKSKANISMEQEKERERYLSRWTSLLTTTEESDGIIETELSYSDIPWPIYKSSEPNTKLDKSSIKTFLSHMAMAPYQGQTQTGGKEKEIMIRRREERKVLREAIKNFHPDRFLSKVLPRVREGEREQVKEGMEICSRVLTELITDNSSGK